MHDFFGGDDASQDPFMVVKTWLNHAEKRKEPQFDAVHLATVDSSGLPDLRVVYVREIEENGFVFYTNYQSRKGQELQSGKAAINYYFPNWGRQIRIRGLVEKVSAEQSDRYFLSRPENSRLGAWMSQQSRPVASRAQMEKELAEIDPAKANERPPHWGGYRLTPLEIEFWAMVDFRIHDRFLWKRENEGEKWDVSRLYP